MGLHQTLVVTAMPNILLRATRVASILFLLSTIGAAQSHDRKNIILFLVDDLGWQDTEVPFFVKKTPFNRIYRTPALARLASRATLFTDAYAASCVCTPTRISIMTGQNPARHHVTNWILRENVEIGRASCRERV